MQRLDVFRWLTVVSTALSAFAFLEWTAIADDRRLEPLSIQDIALALELEGLALPQLRLPRVDREPASIFSKQPDSLRGVKLPDQLRNTAVVVSIVGAPGLLREDAPRRVQVTRYDYETGLTVETTVDLDAGKALDVSIRRSRVAPLSAVEIDFAINLALTQTSEFRAAVLAVGLEQAGFVPLIIADANKGSKTYGHRLVLVSADGAPNSPRVLVDLSSQTVLSSD